MTVEIDGFSFRTDLNEILSSIKSDSFKQKLRLWFWKHDKLNTLYYHIVKLGLLNRITAQFRPMPKFIILGFHRSGTSSLYEYLLQHKDLASSTRKKEIHFFSFGYHMGINWYKAHFPITKKMLFDASPTYATHPEAPTRIKQHLPNSKFIVILRNPIDSCYSQYCGMRAKGSGLEEFSFEDCIMQDDARLQYYFTNVQKFKLWKMDFYIPYVSIKKYDIWLKPYLELFPKSSFCFLDFNDFYSNTDGMLSKVFSFLGVEEQKINDLSKYNTAKYPPMNENTRKKLRDIFKPHKINLEKMIGMTFDWD